MQKYVLVTAGSTSESIDSVRSITNTATGKLGSIIADKFIEKNSNVIYICSNNTIHPKLKTTDTILINGVMDLDNAVKNLSQSYKFDCIVHSMAVSDYTVKGVTTYSNISDSVLNGKELEFESKNSKLSSSISDPIIFLEKAPKIIGKFRILQPQAILVGFKLLSGVTEEELYSVAMNLMVENSCDFVCANDMDNITENKHEAILINKNGSYNKLNTKYDIAHDIVTSVLKKWGI